MKANHRNVADVHQTGLDHALEPLASYICAADRPSDALEAVLTALLGQVAETNRAARVGIASFLETRTHVLV
jgi:hypothetical protein